MSMGFELSSVYLCLLSGSLCLMALKGLPPVIKPKSKISIILGIIGILITITVVINPSAVDRFRHISGAFVGLMGAVGYLLISPVKVPIVGSISAVFIIGSIFMAGFLSTSWVNFSVIILVAADIVLACILIQKMLSAFSTKDYREKKNGN